MPTQIPVSSDTIGLIANNAARLVLIKNARYKDAWRRRGLPGIIVRLEDKLARIAALTDGDALALGHAGDEALEDTITDMIGYLLLARIRVNELRADAQANDRGLP